MTERRSILSDKEIASLCEDGESALISDAPDFATQLQPAGFDVTVGGVTTLTDTGTIGGPYRSKLPSESAVPAHAGYYDLDQGSYLVYINEYVRFPLSIGAVAYPRSTLFRCGASITSGFWDPGFEGRGRLGLNVYSEHGIRIESNCTIAQLVFYVLDEAEKGFQFNAFYRES